MTAQILFDTARFRDRLTSSGMPDAQARAVTEGMDEALRGATATKADLDRWGEGLDGQIKSEAARLEHKIGAETARLEHKISAETARLEHKISAETARLDAKIDAVEARLEEAIGRRIAEAMAAPSRWIIASLFGGLGLLFAALKLFP